jgi:hypothetical protein
MLEGRTVGKSKRKEMKNWLRDSMKQGRTAVGRAMLEGRTVGSSKKGMKKGLGYSMVEGRTVVGRAMLHVEGRTVGK